MKASVFSKLILTGILATSTACSQMKISPSPSTQSELSSESAERSGNPAIDSVANQITEGTEENEILNLFLQRILSLESNISTILSRLESIDEQLRRTGGTPSQKDKTFNPRDEGMAITYESVKQWHANGPVYTSYPQVTFYRNSRGISVSKAALLFCNLKGYNESSGMIPTTDSGGYTSCSERILRYIPYIDEKGTPLSLVNEMVSPCSGIVKEVSCYNK